MFISGADPEFRRDVIVRALAPGASYKTHDEPDRGTFDIFLELAPVEPFGSVEAHAVSYQVLVSTIDDDDVLSVRLVRKVDVDGPADDPNVAPDLSRADALISAVGGQVLGWRSAYDIADETSGEWVYETSIHLSGPDILTEWVGWVSELCAELGLPIEGTPTAHSGSRACEGERSSEPPHLEACAPREGAAGTASLNALHEVTFTG